MGSFKIPQVIPLLLHFLFYNSIAEQPPQYSNPSLLLLFNCSAQFPPDSSLTRYCTLSHVTDKGAQYSCLYVDGIEKYRTGFDMRNALNCSNYRWAIGSPLNRKVGTRMSFDVPDHVPNPCDECKKLGGHCGVGLKCLCHPKECKQQLISGSESNDMFCSIICSVLASIAIVTGILPNYH